MVSAFPDIIQSIRGPGCAILDQACSPFEKGDIGGFGSPEIKYRPRVKSKELKWQQNHRQLPMLKPPVETIPAVISW